MREATLIGEQRRRLGLTQQKLAKMAGVSQSLVAKIEKGSVDAAYSKVMSLFEALEQVQTGKEKTAGEIMHAGIDCASPEDTLQKAALKMSKRAISQMPVSEGKQIVGSISEGSILSCLSSGRKSDGVKVREAMEEAFPNVLPTTPVSSVASLLRHHAAVIVMRKGKVAGIITKADVLRSA